MSDVYSKVSERADVIAANAPFSPRPPNVKSSDFFDYGGINGYDVITRIVKGAPLHLTPGGEVYIVMAEYLGIEENFGEPLGIFSRMQEAGLVPERVATKDAIVRKGGITEKTLEYIASLYPGYIFSIDGASTSNVQIIRDAIKQGVDIGYKIVVVKGRLVAR